LSQITNTLRWRRTILHLAHLFFTDAETFIMSPRGHPSRVEHPSPLPPPPRGLAHSHSYAHSWTHQTGRASAI